MAATCPGATGRSQWYVAARHVVVPTFNERGNVEELVARLQSALCGTSHEILFVDDSTDDTADVVGRVAARCPGVRLVQRVGAQRTGGLWVLWPGASARHVAAGSS